MKIYKIVLIAGLFSVVLIIVNLLNYSMFLKRQNDLLYANISQITQRIEGLEKKMSFKKATPLRAATIPAKEPKLKTKEIKGNKGFLIKSSQPKRSVQ